MVNLYIGRQLVLVGREVETLQHFKPGIITAIVPPTRPGNAGRVYVRFPGTGYAEALNPAHIGAEWRDA